MKKYWFRLIGIIAVIFLMQSCVDLKHVSSFSKTGIESLKKSSEISYNATKRCKDDCEINGLMAQLVSTKKFEDKTADIVGAPSNDCPCPKYVKADNCVSAFNDILIAYLTALNKLSDPKAVNTSFDKLSAATNDLAVNASLTSIKPADVEAASGLAKLITDFILNGYRQTKLKDAIDKADGPLSMVIDAYIAALTEQQKMINEERPEWRNYYNAMHIIDNNETNTPAYLKALKEKDAELKKQYNLIEVFKASLTQLKSAHNVLKLNSGNLDEKALANQLNGFTQNLISIYNQFNNSKK